MVEFVRDVMIAVAVLVTLIAFAVRSGAEHEPTPRARPAEQPGAAEPIAKVTLAAGNQRGK
jgi:hypothetical protein